ncbi:hypothetical protein HDU93_005274 [Gonapodya sp. JEL0774]|nr:hypothetical protein HDU93_005274 [Gonapodya sp. JEL0774]
MTRPTLRVYVIYKPQDYIKRIEDAADEYVNAAAANPPKFVTVKGVPRQSFSLGDRVVFADETGSVPVGMKGTVVGVKNKLVDVVFDMFFESSSATPGKCVLSDAIRYASSVDVQARSIADRSSRIRRAKVHYSTLINLLNRQPPVSSENLATLLPINQASQLRKSIPHGQLHNTGGDRAGSYHSQPLAPLPGNPPLNGAWSQGPIEHHPGTLPVVPSTAAESRTMYPSDNSDNHYVYRGGRGYGPPRPRPAQITGESSFNGGRGKPQVRRGGRGGSYF